MPQRIDDERNNAIITAKTTWNLKVDCGNSSKEMSFNGLLEKSFISSSQIPPLS